jgi:hypothetical protein
MFFSQTNSGHAESDFFWPLHIPDLLNLTVFTTTHFGHVVSNGFDYNTFHPCWIWLFYHHTFQTCLIWCFWLQNILDMLSLTFSTTTHSSNAESVILTLTHFVHVESYVLDHDTFRTRGIWLFWPQHIPHMRNLTFLSKNRDNFVWDEEEDFILNDEV